MRNFSKVLALVLALAMVMTMFAGAVELKAGTIGGYDALTTDAGKAATDILATLGVVKGNASGDIQATKTITRAEAAKLVYAAKTGDVEGSAQYYNAASSFSDVEATDWFANVITWAEANKILNGYPNGTVKPNDNVTGVAFAKMLLAAMGKNDSGKLTGSNWIKETLTLAGNLGITANVSENLYAAITKEAAYTMTANALYAENMAMAKAAFNLIDVTAVAVANDNISLGIYWPGADIALSGTNLNGYVKYVKAPAGYTTFAYRDYSAATSSNGIYAVKVFNAATFVSDKELGTEYRVLATGAVNNYVSSEYRTVYGILAESSETFTKNVKTAATTTIKEGTTNFFVNGSATASKGTAAAAVDNTVFVNGVAKDLTYFAKLANDTAIASDKATAIKNTTAPVYYYDNNADGIVDTLHVFEYTLATVYAVAEDGTISYTTNANAVASKKLVVDGGETLAVGDYIAVYNDNDNYFAKKLTTVNGAITGYNGSYTINGVSYKLGDLATARAKAFFDKATQYILNSAQYTFITDEDANSHFIVDVMVNENTSYGDYALVAEVSTTGSDYYKPYIKLFTADNTIKLYSVASINGYLPYQTINTGAYMSEITSLVPGTIVSYIVSGNEVHLTTAKWAGDQNTTDAVDYIDYESVTYNGDVNMWVNSASKLIDTNAATVFVVRADDDDNANYWKAYKMGEFYGVNITTPVRASLLTYNYGTYTASVAQVLKAYLAADQIPATVFANNGKIVLVKSGSAWTLETADGVYTHTVATIAPVGGSTETFTYKSYSPINTLTTGAYVVSTDENGIMIDYTAIDLGTGLTGVSNAIMTESATIDSYYKDAYGKMTLILKANGGATKAVTFAADATIYCVSGLDTTAMTGATYETLFNAINGITVMNKEVTIASIYNAAGEIQTAFINIK